MEDFGGRGLGGGWTRHGVVLAVLIGVVLASGLLTSGASEADTPDPVVAALTERIEVLEAAVTEVDDLEISIVRLQAQIEELEAALAMVLDQIEAAATP